MLTSFRCPTRLPRSSLRSRFRVPRAPWSPAAFPGGPGRSRAGRAPASPARRHDAHEGRAPRRRLLSERFSLAALRFNFRGVGASAGAYDGGAGETEDLVAAAAWLRARQPDGPFVLSGFSFGSLCALRPPAPAPRVLLLIGVPIDRDEPAGAVPEDPRRLGPGRERRVQPIARAARDRRGARLDVSRRSRGGPLLRRAAGRVREGGGRRARGVPADVMFEEHEREILRKVATAAAARAMGLRAPAGR